MRVLLIGRMRSRKSGLSVVSDNWFSMLEKSTRWKADVCSDLEINYPGLKKYDLIILSGDSSVKNNVYRKIRENSDAIIVALSLIRDSIEDKRDMKRLDLLNEKFGNVFFAVWDHSFFFNTKFDEHRDMLVSLPKPLNHPKPILGERFGNRRGVCLGHGEKLFNGRFAGRSKYDNLNNPREYIPKLIKTFPKVPFYVYENCKAKIKGLKRVSPGNGLIREFLPTLKAFVSLQSNETFYMVPIEAQGVGTPVIYRHMPQSITPYIGSSGMIVDDIDDLIYYIDKMHRKSCWEAMRHVGILNARSRSWSQTFETMGMTLENLVRKNK